ncbi:hypothetical protein [Thalassotalea maritima]|uniref:hypothetical protein n=1 Tax=Thalassotalea maritima TaxID=3242416 RepID=UPI003527BBD5
MKYWLWAFYIVLALVAPNALAEPEPTNPEQHTPDPLTSLYMIRIDSINKDAFEKALIDHMQFRAKQNEQNNWQVYTQVIGEDLNMYMLRSCCTNWDKIEEHNAWAVMSNTAQHWRDNVSQYVVDSARYFSRIDRDNSHWDSSKVYKYFGVESLTVAPGKGFAARAGIKAISAAAKQMQWPDSWAWHTRIGGEAQIQLVFGYDSYADMMPPEKNFYQRLSEHLTSEQAAQAMISEYKSAFLSSNYAIYVYRKGLSSPE